MKFKTNQEIFDFVAPFAQSAGVELVDVDLKVSKNPSLTIYIDTESGIDLDTLELFHNQINEPLDELDPTFGMPYTLNVSSPGVDRPFKTERDFEKNVGKRVEIKLFAPIKGTKNFEGIMTAFDKNTITIILKGEETKIERTQIAKICQAISF